MTSKLDLLTFNKYILLRRIIHIIIIIIIKNTLDSLKHKIMTETKKKKKTAHNLVVDSLVIPTIRFL